MKKRITIISVTVFVLLTGVVFTWILFADNQQFERADISPSDTTSSSTEQTTRQTLLSEQPILNDLTGLPIEKIYANQRPVAVMIDNVEQGQPLLGVSQADVMYECLVEGSITRIMAVFKNPYNLNLVGAIRSARPYFINLANGMNAIFVHVGASTHAFDMINNGEIDSINLDANPDYMWRDSNRRSNLGYEHSAVTSGELLKSAIQNKNFNTVYSNFTPIQKFGDSSQIQNGKDCDKITVTFSWYKNTVFTYDKLQNTYSIFQFNKAQMDGTSNKQISRPNVLALYVNTYSTGDGSLQQLDLVGSGDGYYINSGKIIPILWKRNTSNSQFEFFDGTGKPLIMKPGQIYICCVPFEGSIEYN